MQRIMLARGSGYADDRSFDDYDIIAHPLPKRDDRIFPGREDSRGYTSPGVTYASHEIKLGRRKDRFGYGNYAILMHHGGGTEIVAIPRFADHGVSIEALIAMPEHALYAMLYTMYRMASEADRTARAETEQTWADAFVQKRIKASRARQGRKRVEIVAPAVSMQSDRQAAPC